jgi:hypothetical protein
MRERIDVDAERCFDAVAQHGARGGGFVRHIRRWQRAKARSSSLRVNIIVAARK